jgi:hypothetical protein
MHPKTVCLVLSILALVAGALGMALSFVHLALAGMGGMEDVVAGGTGLIAGSILFGAGLISATLLYARGPARPGAESVPKFRLHASPED